MNFSHDRYSAKKFSQGLNCIGWDHRLKAPLVGPSETRRVLYLIGKYCVDYSFHPNSITRCPQMNQEHILKADKNLQKEGRGNFQEWEESLR